MSLVTRTIEAAFPLTPLQEGMLYHTIRDPALGTFHVQTAAELDGPLVLTHFARAWELATERHAALRTFFAWQGRERPLQVVRPRVSVDLDLVDWSGADVTAQVDRWSELLRRDRARGLDLGIAPLMRVTVVRIAPDRHKLLWAMHHAVMDGWSALVVLDEVMRDYAQLIAGETPNVDPAPSFDRFVGWIESRDAASDEQFWRYTIGGRTEPTPLPGGVAGRRQSGDRVSTTLALTDGETSNLRATAANVRVTINTLLMGAWAIMLARHSDRSDVTFGVTVSERPAELPDVERAAGLYLSTVPVVAPDQRDIVVSDWLRDLQLALSEARAHAAPGLATIQRWSGLTSHTRLFESLVVFENFPEDRMRPFTADASDDRSAANDTLVLRSAAIDVPNDVPLVLLALPGDRLTLTIVHDPAIVPEDIAARLPSQLATILKSFCEDPNGAVDDAALLGADERSQLLDDWSGARVQPPTPVDVLDRLEQHASTHPNDVALQTDDARISYAALDRHANRLARRLAANGLGPGTFVGLLTEHSSDAIVGMLAALKAGAAYVPLEYRAPNARLQRIIDRLDAVLVVPALASRIHETDRTLLLDDAADQSDAPPARVDTPESAAYVVFTSGSTGEPKGVVVERGHLAASNSARDVYYPESPRRFLLLSSTSVDSSLVGIFWTLTTGGCVVLPAPRAEQDVDGLARLIEREDVTHTLMVPSLYRALLEHADPRRLESLRCVIVAGESCPADVARLHHARLPTAALHNEYGPSEATVWATAALLGRDEADARRVAIGRPIAGTRVYLLDARLNPVPAGSVGEICIGGACVARGYLGLPDETAQRFVADRFVPGRRMYRTGDRGRFRADGQLEFLGRTDEQIKVRGFRVEPREIERVLVDHPDIREAAVALVRPTIASDLETLVAALAELSDDEAENLLHDVEAMA